MEFRGRNIEPDQLSVKISNDVKKALNNSSMNDQSTPNKKCDFCLALIFNGLQPMKMLASSLCQGNSELISLPN